MTSLSAPKVAIKVQPVVKIIVYAGVTSELVKNTGLKDTRQIEALQKVVADGLVSKVIVRLCDRNGCEESYTLSLPSVSTADTIDLVMEAGKSYAEMVDVSLAAAIQLAANQMERRKLTPRFEVEWSPKAKAAPHLVADAARTLNLSAPPTYIPPPKPITTPQWMVPPSPTPTPPLARYPQTFRTYTAPPPTPPGFERKTIAEIKPAKDPGLTFTIESVRRA